MFNFPDQYFRPLETGLSGFEIIKRVLKGHVVRRATWSEVMYIRLTNEQGYDEDGYAISGESSLLTIATDGYFCHFGYSGQPTRDPHVLMFNVPQVDGREEEGLNWFLSTDWEDYGFVPQEEFSALCDKVKNYVRAYREREKEHARTRAMETFSLTE